MDIARIVKSNSGKKNEPKKEGGQVKKSVPFYENNDPPKTLDDHTFFGLKLDPEQKVFRDAIWNPDKLIVFCDSKAGTGKSLVAVATAMLMVQYGLYDGLTYIMACDTGTRSIGYLPGTVDNKIEPYKGPMYDALLKIGINPEMVVDSPDTQKMGSNIVEFVSPTYLRGRNYERRVIILEEAQNYTFDDLKKTLTRCHDDCCVIVIGHHAQDDRVRKDNSFSRYIDHFKDQEFCEVCTLTTNHRGKISTWADELEA